MLEVIGDFSAAEMKAKLEQLFGDWKYTQPPFRRFPRWKTRPRRASFWRPRTTSRRPSFTSANWAASCATRIIRRWKWRPRFWAADSPAGCFAACAPSTAGRTTSPPPGRANYDHPGTFEISGSTQSAHTVDTLKAIGEELEKIRTTEVTDEELQTAKDTVLNGFVFNFDRPSKTINRLMIYQYYGYPKDFIFQYQKAIAAVTKADVLRVAQAIFSAEESQLCRGGQSEGLRNAAGQPGNEGAADRPHAFPSRSRRPRRPIRRRWPRAKRSCSECSRLWAARTSWPPSRICNFTPTSKCSLPGASMKVKQTNSFIAPSTVRQDNELPFLKQSVYSDGTSGWLSGMQGVQNLTPPVLKQIHGEAFRQIASLALSDRDADRTVNQVADGVLEISSKDGESVRITVDEKTGLPAKLAYQQSPAEGGTAVEEIFSDWRDVDGLRLPFQWSVMQGGKKFAGVTIQDYKINSGLTAETLGKKPAPQRRHRKLRRTTGAAAAGASQ